MTAATTEGWVFVTPDSLPEQWRGRTVPVLMVPLTGAEVAAALGGRPAGQGIGAEDEPLVALTARGLSTRTIAAELQLTPRQVERRLAALRARLGVASKAELAASLARLGFGGPVGKPPVDVGGAAASAQNKEESQQ